MPHKANGMKQYTASTADPKINQLTAKKKTQASPISIHAPHVGVFMLPIKQ